MSIAHTSRRLACASSPFTILGLFMVLVTVACSNPDLDSGGSSSGGTGSGSTGGSEGNFGGSGAVTPGAAGAPPDLVTDFCDTDDLTGIPASGTVNVNFESGDMIPLCDGWVFIADKTNDRLVLMNIVSGDVDSTHDLVGAPEDLELDLANKRMYVTMPDANAIASVDLIGDTDFIAAVNSAPGSITQAPGHVLVAADAGLELRVYTKPTLVHVANSPDLKGSLIRFNEDSGQLISLSDSQITLYDIVIGAAIVTLTDDNDDPSPGEALGLEISPNNLSAVVVSNEGNATFVGPNVLNDFQTVNMDNTFGAWKIEGTPAAGGFSSETAGGVGASDFFLAASTTDLIIFDIARHAEISRTTPGSSCEGKFDRVGFSRGDAIAIGKAKCISPVNGTEISWVAPATGFGTSTSAVGIDLAALGLVLPAAEVDPLCSNDDVDALTSASAGTLVVPASEDFIALCDGLVFVAERATNRVRLINVITGTTLSEWDLPDMASDMIIDEANKLLFAIMPGGGGLARIDIAGPNMGTLTIREDIGFPNSITLGAANTVWVANHSEVPELLLSGFDGVNATLNPVAIRLPLEVVFPKFNSQIAFDRTRNIMFVSDDDGSARFTQGGASFDLVDMNEELFDELNSEIILDSPDNTTIALVDQTGGFVYDLDDGELADFGDTFWDVDSLNAITNITFNGVGDLFGVATTEELVIFEAEGTQLETNFLEPANCPGDANAKPAISRGGGLGYFKSDCGVVGATETIFWFEL